VVLKGNRDLRWSYFVFGQNYLTDLPYFFVSWSLCVEEHFYLMVAPIALLIFRLRRWGIPFLVIVIGTPVLCRTFGWYHDLGETHVRFDECATGVLLAGLSIFAPGAWKKLCSVAPIIAAAAAVAYGYIIWVRWHPRYAIGLDEQTLCALIFGSFVLLAVSSESWKQRLYLPGCSYLATRAYAVYLLHPESLALLRRFQLRSFVVFTVLTLIITLIGAEVLYRVIERPVMNAREWFGFSRSLKLQRAGSTGDLSGDGMLDSERRQSEDSREDLTIAARAVVSTLERH
jgi:peptidoglycan/LPS O-acetylase OafA/YrhL